MFARASDRAIAGGLREVADPLHRRRPRRDVPRLRPGGRAQVASTVPAGSPAPLEPDSPVLAGLAGIPADAIRAAQAGLVADMDRVADVLYGRAPA